MLNTLLTLFLLLLPDVHAKAVIAQTELQIAMSDVEPISYSDNGHFKGLNYDILSSLEKESGLKFNYRLLPHARLVNLLPIENPDISIVFAVVCNKFPNEYETQSVLYRMKPTIYLKNGTTPSKDLRVGRVRGTCSDLMKENVKPENVIEVTDIHQAISMLQLGRIEGICAVDALMNYSLKRHPGFKEKLTVFKAQNHVDDFDAVICRKKSLPADVKTKLEKGAKKLKIEH